MEEFKEIFLLIKDYIQKQKENITLGATENAIKLFYVASMGLIVFMLSSIILLLASFALAFWINDITGSNIIGFGSLAGAILVLTLLLWFKRKQWVLQPIARMIVRILLDNTPTETNNSTTQVP